MNQRETAYRLMASSQIACREGRFPTTAALKNLLEQGFCELTAGGYFMATAATPLAMLYRPDIDSAERLVRERKVSHGDASKPVKVSMARLTKKGFAARGDYGWKPTEKLMNAINCWYESKKGGCGE